LPTSEVWLLDRTGLLKAELLRTHLVFVTIIRQPPQMLQQVCDIKLQIQQREPVLIVLAM